MSTPAQQLPTITGGNTKLAGQQLARARIGMMGSGCAFITSVCFSMKQVFTDEVSRAGTDGRIIYYNPDWFVTLNPREQIGLVVHETWHAALNHCKLQKYSRMGKRDPKLWNVAADGIINNYIIDSGMELPLDRIDMPECRGMSTEQVYELLLERVQQQQVIPVLDPDNVDILEPAKEGDEDNDAGLSEAEQCEMSNDMKQILVRAAMVSKMAGENIGNLPADLQFTLDQITNPKLPWPRLVQRFFTARAKTLYNFARPNRRYYPKHFLPSKGSKTLDRVLTAIDMSSSCSDEQVATFVAEVASCLRSVQPKSLTLIEFDVRVTQVTKLTGAQALVNHKFKGRGGTYITPVIQYANDNPADLLVIFTDGGFNPSTVDPTMPVLWVIYDNPYFTCPFGTIIHVEV